MTSDHVFKKHQNTKAQNLISRDAYISVAYLIQIACCSLQLFSITYEYEASEIFFFSQKSSLVFQEYATTYD